MPDVPFHPMLKNSKHDHHQKISSAWLCIGIKIRQVGQSAAPAEKHVSLSYEWRHLVLNDELIDLSAHRRQLLSPCSIVVHFVCWRGRVQTAKS